MEGGPQCRVPILYLHDPESERRLQVCAGTVCLPCPSLAHTVLIPETTLRHISLLSVLLIIYLFHQVEVILLIQFCTQLHLLDIIIKLDLL